MTKMIGTRDAAELLGVSQRRVRVLCEQGRIKGAVRIGRSWAVPETIRIAPGSRGPVGATHTRRR